MAIHVWVNVAATVFMSLSAWHNYPGGEALTWTNRHILSQQNESFVLPPTKTSVYVCNLAAQTGFTRFLELENVYYDKSPQLMDSHFEDHFLVNYLVMEKSDVNAVQTKCSAESGKEKGNMICQLGGRKRHCKILKPISGFTGIDFSMNKQVSIKTAPMLWVFRCQI